LIVAFDLRRVTRRLSGLNFKLFELVLQR
jgi:hypothetical protein